MENKNKIIMGVIVVLVVIGIFLLVPSYTKEPIITDEEDLPESEEILEESEEILKYSWENEGNGFWTRTDLECDHILQYICESNCYENIEVEINPVNKLNVWDCDNFIPEGIAEQTQTDTGVNVICFSSSCVPLQDCSIACPTG